MTAGGEGAQRVLIVMPSWVGDAVMATPALRALRGSLPGACLGALLKPGIDQVLAGTDFFDEIVVDSQAGMMGPKRAASKLRDRRYRKAVLFTNSFSTALVTRMAGIPERFGYDRDGRFFLLTDRLTPPRRGETPPFDRGPKERAWAPVPACEYYMALARHFLNAPDLPMGPMTLATTAEEESAADAVLTAAGVGRQPARLVILNPGGNNPAKRWPADRFAALARRLEEERSAQVVIAGAPAEADLASQIAAEAGLDEARALPRCGLTLGSLKAALRRARLLVTNDTGPRHIAAAFGTPVVTLFGPTDPRWTTIPFEQERVLVADPSLPAHETAEDHPDRCRVERIGLEGVFAEADALLPP